MIIMEKLQLDAMSAGGGPANDARGAVQFAIDLGIWEVCFEWDSVNILTTYGSEFDGNKAHC